MPPLTSTELASIARETVQAVDSAALLDQFVFRDEVTLVIAKQWIKPVIRALRQRPELAFDMLSDVTAVDYLELGRVPRFDVVYQLVSLNQQHRLRLRAPVGENEEECLIDSIRELWSGADFMEREVFDMFGIRFVGHPNLTRILMPDNWVGHPLRKDFPLGGAKSFYLKQDTDEYAGEPGDLVPRIRVQDGDV